jgi:hypothetical protein
MFTSLNAIAHFSARRMFAAAALVTAVAAPGAAAAQIPFEQAIQELASENPTVRIKTLEALRDARYPEAAIPVSTLIVDKQDSVQLQAIATELDIFLVDKVTTRKFGDPVVEKRDRLSAENAFAAGPLLVSLRPVPSEVLNALRVAAQDENQHVGGEALYAFGTLTTRTDGAARLALQRVSIGDLVTLLEGRSSNVRKAAARVIGRFYARRPSDPPVDAAIGDALLAALNDKSGDVRAAATKALGDIRYERAVEVLSEVVNSKGKDDVREDALDALAWIADPASADLFREQLSSPSPACRRIGVEGLARLPGVKIGDLQNALQKEQTDEVQLALSFAATMLTDAPIDQIGEALVRPRLYDQARRYLIELAPGHPNRFTRHAMDPDNRIRVEVAEVMTLAGDQSALPLVTPLASDRDPVVAFAGTRAVARLRSTVAKPAS